MNDTDCIGTRINTMVKVLSKQDVYWEIGPMNWIRMYRSLIGYQQVQSFIVIRLIVVCTVVA
jgi:hypothetical protein